MGSTAARFLQCVPRKGAIDADSRGSDRACSCSCRSSARKLFHVEPVRIPAVQGEEVVRPLLEQFRREGEGEGRLVAQLLGALREVDRSPVQATRSARLEASDLK